MKDCVNNESSVLRNKKQRRLKHMLRHAPCFFYQEESDSDTAQRRRKGVLLSDSEVEDEDVSWVWVNSEQTVCTNVTSNATFSLASLSSIIQKPSPKKARAYNFDRSKKSKTRKSSSGEERGHKRRASFETSG